MVVTTLERKTVRRNRTKKRPADKCPWPGSIIEAYERYTGPYNVENASTLLEEENLEIYNGWPVWQEMTDLEERRIAGIIQEILSLAARAARLGQAYPDQVECLLSNGEVIKPDVCVISERRVEAKAIETGPDKRIVLQGGPELAIELRSPSNTRAEDKIKRQKYFDNGTLIVWDIDPKKHKIWVYRAEQPQKSKLFVEGDLINCEPLLPGWQRPVADFFNPALLTAEQIVGEIANQWREESREQGKLEGQLQTLRQVIMLQAKMRFGGQLPADLETRLTVYNSEQLTNLIVSLALTSELENWLKSFPD